jgi:hypothetical protein
VKAVVHAKELEVKSWFDAAGLVYVSHDKMVDHGECSRYRPDFLFDAVTHLKVTEVDEHQHFDRACECEQIRMVNMYHAMDGRPLVFLRINPDGYKPLSGKPLSRAARRAAVIKWTKWLLTDPEACPTARGALCEVRYLFFDGCDGTAAPTKIV